LKEEKMGGCHSYNGLCGGIFAGNVTENMEDVTIRETTKGKVDSEENAILVEDVTIRETTKWKS
jgi:hypothetical protein